MQGGGIDLVETWAEAWQSGARVATLELVDGTVTRNWATGTTHSASLTVAGFGAMVPETEWVGTDRHYGDGTFGSGTFGDYRHRAYRTLLMPIKTQVRIFWKATVGADTETVELARLTVTDVSFLDEDTDTITISAADPSTDLSGAKFLTPHTIAAGTNVATAIAGILTAVRPGSAFTHPSTTHVTAKLAYLPGDGNDPWKVITELAAAAGWEIGCDRLGGFVAIVPDPGTGTQVWDLADTGTAIKFDLTPDAADFCNTVICLAEGSGETPVYAIAQDTTSGFGTTALGRAVTREYRSATITTKAQAQNTANALLRKWSQVTEVVKMDCYPVPHLDPYDVVGVSSQGLELDDDTYRITAITVPLVPGSAHQITVSRRIT